MAWFTLLDHSPNFAEAGYTYYIPIYSISNPFLLFYVFCLVEKDNSKWICSPSRLS